MEHYTCNQALRTIYVEKKISDHVITAISTDVREIWTALCEKDGKREIHYPKEIALENAKRAIRAALDKYSEVLKEKVNALYREQKEVEALKRKI